VSNFYNITYPAARKQYKCDHCTEIIKKGEKHSRQTGIYCGSWYEIRIHQECQEAINNDKYWDPELVGIRYKRGTTKEV